MMQILEHLHNKCNAAANLYYQEYDEHGSFILRPVSMLADCRVSISGNRIAVLRDRKANQTSFGLHRQREAIEGFSKSSGNRLCKLIREVDISTLYFITLTFAVDHDGKSAKTILKKFLRKFNDTYNRNPNSCGIWFLEFQHRGVIHFHLFVSHFVPHKWLQSTWRACVGDSKDNFVFIKRFESGKYGAISYAQKYARKQNSKEYQKLKPPGFGWTGRYWGKFGNIVLAAAYEKFDIDRLNCPKTAVKLQKFSDFIEELKAKGLVWEKEIMTVDKKTGEKVSTGIFIYEVKDPRYLRKLYQLFNDLIDDPAKKLKYPRGWMVNDKQIRPSSAV